VSFDKRTVLHNAFNQETFIFTGPLDGAGVAAFEVILAEGGSGGGNALVHVHPGASETFLVTSGRLRVVMRGVEHVVETGQSVTVPPGVPHHFSNADVGKTAAIITFAPAQQHLRFFANFATLAEKRPEWFSAKGDPNLLLIALTLHTFRDHLYLASIPIVLQKLLFSVLAPLARFRGYRLEIEPLKG
jgi:mannose-6-phosphate isomerase-like protein (cupin superfamily)